MSINIKCDKCKEFFDGDVYCQECICGLELENIDLRNEIDLLKDEIKELKGQN